jgi:mono/diheme cytochrome c family protein
MTSPFYFWITALMVGTGVLSAAAPKKRAALDASELPEPVQRPVKYFGDIHPVLAEHCVSCHGPDKQKGGLRLDSLAAALEGGGSYGPAIVPGKSAESPLILFMAHLEPDMEMPPEEDMLSEQTIAVLRAWIDQGAKWPVKAGGGDTGGESTLGNQALFFQKAATHWAFRPVVKAEADSIKEGSVTIDGLIESRLKEKGLGRSDRADARTLLKRVHFDLTGLPPEPKEMEAFALAFAQDADQAMAAKVDELLASPHFGERWGRYWLDMARYADTQDFLAQADLRYPFAWTYRDYVIDALNIDKPYNEFIREQLAADQMGLKADDPKLAALGFMTVGPRFRRRTDEVINDRIDVVTRGLMGMTVACARCHDHKYDPIPTADFYALSGVFASTDDLEVMPEIALKNREVNPKLRGEYESAKAKVERARTDFVEDLKVKAVADVLAKPEVYFDALVQMEVKKTADVRKLITGKKMLQTALTPLSRQWAEMKKAERWWQDPVIGPLARVAGASPERKAGIIEAVLKSGRVPGGKDAVSAVVMAALRADPPKNEEALVRAYGKLLAQAKESPDEGLKQVVSALSKTGGWLDFSVQEVESAHRLLGAGRKELNDLETAIAEVEATHPGAPARAMAVKDKAKPVTPVIYIRGDAARKGDSVERRFLEVLDPAKTPFPAEKSGRRELADRIASEENPLTARVWANHVWRHLLGRPLVKTPGDFGLQSDPPSHPELLDWLASALMQRGWSTKQLVRDIMLSATYQQVSGDRPEASAVDVDNTLLWRANRRRMDFEAMRDAMLATAGQIDLEMGGRSVNLSTEPFSSRRTVYGYVDRVNLDPLFTTFDFPSPDIATTERSETLVPQQALFALNDAFIVGQARVLAKGAQAAANANRGNPAGAAVEWLYQRVFLRAPKQAESVLARVFMKETSGLRNEGLQGSWSYGFGSADPAAPRMESFTRLAHFDPQTKRYQGGREYPHSQIGFASVSASGGHPGSDLNHAAIRRWVAPYDGEFSIDGEVTVNRQNKGDGVRARILSSRTGLVGEWIADGAAAKTEVAKVKLTRGEVLNFAVDCREGPTSDGYRWSPMIQLLVKAEEAPTDMQTVWDAQADFKGPPPPKLQPLEQMAHALLMTNEFLFVD